MNHPFKRKFLVTSLFIFTLFLPATLIRADHGQWHGPTADPTGGNTPAPINVSSTGQDKAGFFRALNLFTLGGIFFDSLLGSGDTSKAGGQIGFKLPGFSTTNALDIVGSGSSPNRKIRIWDDLYGDANSQICVEGGSCSTFTNIVNGGGGVPAGALNQTLRRGANGWEATSTLAIKNSSWGHGYVEISSAASNGVGLRILTPSFDALQFGNQVVGTVSRSMRIGNVGGMTMRFDAPEFNFLNGNVGIGTENPLSEFHVVGTTTTVGLRVYAGSTALPGRVLTSLDSIGNATWQDPASGGSGLPAGTDGQTVRNLNGVWSPSDLIKVNNTTGNVGMGLGTAPVTSNAKLQVVGTIDTSDLLVNDDVFIIDRATTTNLSIITGAGLNKILVSDAIGRATWQVPSTVPDVGLPTGNTNETLRKDATLGWVPSSNLVNTLAGNIGIGVTNPQNLLTLANNKYLAWKNNAGTSETVGIRSTTVDDLRLFVNGSDRVVVNSSGNVGIGNTAPTSKLDVTGTTTTTGLKIANYNPALGKVLVAQDPTGTAAWKTPAEAGIGDSFWTSALNGDGTSNIRNSNGLGGVIVGAGTGLGAFTVSGGRSWLDGAIVSGDSGMGTLVGAPANAPISLMVMNSGAYFGDLVANTIPAGEVPKVFIKNTSNDGNSNTYEQGLQVQNDGNGWAGFFKGSTNGVRADGTTAALTANGPSFLNGAVTIGNSGTPLPNSAPKVFINNTLTGATDQGLQIQNDGGSWALSATGNTRGIYAFGTNKALNVDGPISIITNNASFPPAAGKVLVAQDGAGTAQWQTLSSIGGGMPTGTDGQTLRWDPTAPAGWKASSIITNSGTNVTINSGSTNLNTILESTGIGGTDGPVLGFKRTGAGASNANYQIELRDSDNLQFATNNDSFGSRVIRMVLTQAGNLGIGVTAPTAKLHVGGTVRFESLGSNTANNDILTVDGSGNVTKRPVGSWTGGGSGLPDGTANGQMLKWTGTGASAKWATTTTEMYENSSGSVLGIGLDTLQSNTTGNYNIALGFNSLKANTTGYANTALGYNVLSSNTTGFYNTALGKGTLISNIDGGANTALGSSALASNVSGDSNTALGYYALLNNVGNYNTAIGSSALYDNTTGNSNIAIGRSTGSNITTGSNNILIGDNIDAPLVSTSNYLNIGGFIKGFMNGSTPSAGSVLTSDANGNATWQAPASGGGLPSTGINGTTLRYDGTSARAWLVDGTISNFGSAGVAISAPLKLGSVEIVTGQSYDSDNDGTLENTDGDRVLVIARDGTIKAKKLEDLYFEASNMRLGSVISSIIVGNILTLFGDLYFNNW